MIFNPINSAYFDIVARVLAEAVRRAKTRKVGEQVMTREEVGEIVKKQLMGDAASEIVDNLFDGEWALMDNKGRVVLENRPILPLTTLEKQWLKTIARDPRIRLFDLPLEELDQGDYESIEPLFELEWFERFNTTGDPDPWLDEQYIMHFRLLLNAIKSGKNVFVRWICREGIPCQSICAPKKLEYSMLDDKFRLQAETIYEGQSKEITINLGRIEVCEVSSDSLMVDIPEELNKVLPSVNEQLEELSLLIEDKRSALDRALVAFSFFQKKEVTKIDTMHYRLKILIYADDREEIVQRVSKFGPLIRVESPQWLIEALRDHIRRQRRLLKKT